MTGIFVFGSNLAGRHGAGAAAYAVKHHGAIMGRGIGLQGNSYAIPTKDESIDTLSIGLIREFVELFKRFAVSNPDLIFNVTRIGCGLAGYRDEDMAPLFSGAPSNCLFPTEWAEYLPGVEFHDLH